MARKKKEKLYAVQISNRRGDRMFLVWDSPQAEKTGVFSLTKMSWRRWPDKQHPYIKFAQPRIAKLFASMINNPYHAVPQVIELD